MSLLHFEHQLSGQSVRVAFLGDVGGLTIGTCFKEEMIFHCDRSALTQTIRSASKNIESHPNEVTNCILFCEAM